MSDQNKTKYPSLWFSKKPPEPEEQPITKEERENIILAANWLEQRMYQKEAASLRALAKRLK